MKQNYKATSELKLFAAAVLFGLAILLLTIIISSVANAQMQTAGVSTPIEIGTGSLPLDHSISVIAGSDPSADAQLQHENTMALIETAMTMGKVCAIEKVAENALHSKKPISLKELSRRADICVKEQIEKIENRK